MAVWHDLGLVTVWPGLLGATIQFDHRRPGTGRRGHVVFWARYVAFHVVCRLPVRVYAAAFEKTASAILISIVTDCCCYQPAGVFLVFFKATRQP